MRKLKWYELIIFVGVNLFGWLLFYWYFLLTKKYGVIKKEINTILILEPWRIGDLVLMIPILEPIRKRWPKAKIVIAASPMASCILKNCPFVDEILTYDFPWTKNKGKYSLKNYGFSFWNFLRTLRKLKPSIALHIRQDMRNNFLLFASGARTRVSFVGGGGRYWINSPVYDDPNKFHRIESWQIILHHIGIHQENLKLRLWVDEDEKQGVYSKWKIPKNQALIAIHASTRNSTRNWGYSNFKILINILLEIIPGKLIIIGDRQVMENVSSKLYENYKELSIYCEPSLRELIVLLSLCSILIAHDGGPVHIGVACGVHVIAIFGPGEPLHFRPYGKDHEILILKDMPCRPCHDNCIFDEPYCLTKLKPESGYEAIKCLAKKMIQMYNSQSID